LIRKILYLLTAKERRRLWGLITANVLISAVDIASLGLLLYIVSFYTRQQSKAPPAFLPAWLTDRDSLALIGLFAVFFLVKSGMGYLILQLQYRFVFRVASRLSETNMLHYLEGSYQQYVKVDASVYIRRISQQPIEFCQYVLAGYQQMVTESMLVVLTVVAIILFSVKIFLLLVVLLLPALVLLAGVSRRKLRSVRSNIKNTSERSLQHLREALTGFVESNLYEKNAFFAQRFAGYQRALNEHLAELQIMQGMPSRLIEVFAVLGLFVLIAFAHWSGQMGAAAFVLLGAFLAAAYKIIPGMVKIVNLSAQVKTYRFVVDDLYDEERTLRYPVTRNIVPPIGKIVFNGVSFSHQQARIVRDLHCCIQPGELLGLSGSSGKGKTTIVNLLLGFLTPDEGEILINDEVVNAVDRQRYWSRIAYVKQQPFLLHDTVLKNITLTDGDYDAERLQEAVGVTSLERLEGGRDATLAKMITENGKNISGGQRQRIAFARALYKDADLLILDEPFSELDEDAERELLDYCLQLTAGGKAILLITHNKKNLTRCHKIILLDEE
jgi:ABC-type multidrug transport system fused ATPase/permease subunit